MQVNITVNDLAGELVKRNYIASPALLEAIYAAIKLEIPLLVDGAAGVGKTELAKVLADIFSANLIRLQCYDGIKAEKVLYEMDASKMKTYTDMLSTKMEQFVQGLTWQDAINKAENERFFNSESFLIKRPVLQALEPDDNRYQLLLIDEIDKVPQEVEAMLLEPLSDYSMSIPEIGRTVQCKQKPLVVLTCNDYRELGEALVRRCSYCYIEYPTFDTEVQIITLKANTDIKFAGNMAKLLYIIRNNANMVKPPSIAEGIQFSTLIYHYYNIKEFDFMTYKPYFIQACCTLAKKKEDVYKLRDYLQSLIWS